MSRMVNWLQVREQKLFFWFNHKLQHTITDRVMNIVTHLGGATFTIVFCLCLITLFSRPWSLVGIQALTALAVSHIPVAIIKRKYPRLRPYLVLPKTITCKNPLKDHSFPSGHTTAIFAVSIPLLMLSPSLSFIVLPLALTVAASRIILGLHYPSDVAVGAIIGSTAAFISASMISF
ncbi:phosphatase PAP2 family protein [Marinicrinis lubricantis]|uniref:Phosphatase PAP2 family protein n=1 Tax=Marinicrinis lubricantis TaxID=2086470 RepID=A0ABW1IQC1_9BACL